MTYMTKGLGPLLRLAGFGLASLGWAAAAQAAEVNEAAMRALESDGTEWLSYDRTWAQQRFSPLQQIDTESVDKLGLTWSIDLDNNRGLEATPLYHEGVLYTSLSWSRVMAVDAGTGQILWSYDPQVDKAKGRDACCDAVNRGVALWQGKVYVGTLDGRLIALDAKTGAATGAPGAECCAGNLEQGYRLVDGRRRDRLGQYGL